MQNQSDFSKAFFNKMREICERQIVNTTEKIMTNEQQRIVHLEKLADDAGKTLAFLQSRVDTLTAERDQLIQKNTALVSENVWMDAFVDALLSIAWQGGSADGAEIQELALKHGLLRQEVYSADEHESLVKGPCNFEDGDSVYFRVKTPATDAAIAAIRAEGVDLAIVLHKKINGSGVLSVSALEYLSAQIREGAQK